MKIYKYMLRGLFSGMCIGLGALLSSIALTENTGFGMSKLFASASFSVGLFMSLVGSGALFTGLVATVCKRIKDGELGEAVAEFIMAWICNFIGATLLVVLLFPVAENVSHTFVNIGVAKTSLSLIDMFWKAFFCNVLVCLAVLLYKKANTYIDAFMCVLIPVTTFVCCGFEHSIANMFYLPMAKLCGAPISLLSIALSIGMVTIGNLVGGFFMSYYAYEMGEFDEK